MSIPPSAPQPLPPSGLGGSRDGLVTGEAVVLELQLAKLPSRALAIALDLALELAVLFGLLAVGSALAADGALVATVGLVTVVAVLVGYPAGIETLTRGRSLGKLALGLRVVRDDGGPVGFRQALVRALAGFFIDFWLTFGVGAILSSLASTKGKRVGDQFAGTVVIRERVAVQGAPLAAMPPTLAGWATALDLSRVPDDLALSARQFLSRAHELAPDVRAALGARLASDVVARIAPPPPAGAPPEAVLAAVLAERRRRDYARLVGWPQPAYGPPPPPPPVVGAGPAPAPPGWSQPPPPGGGSSLDPAQAGRSPGTAPPAAPAPPARDEGGAFAPPS